MPRHPPRPFLQTSAVLATLTVVMFFDALFAGRTTVLGNQTTDLFSQFIGWRQFGFGELAKGHLALWNPHVYSGAPYFGGFQGALLYPPNWLFLILPLPVAINWSIALHVFLLGAFMNLWAARRGLHPAAACLAGALTMFCGAHFSHIYAGHLTNLCTMVWAPLILLAIDEIFVCGGKNETTAREFAGWGLLGAGALAMQIFAGHPQYVFYTGVAAAIYGALRFATALRERRRLPAKDGDAHRTPLQLAALAAIPLGGVALAAVQLLTGAQASRETVRSEALPYEFASMFSFPPENLLTLIAPKFFGDLSPADYFGRCYLWEMSLFLGVTALALAIYGAVGQRSTSNVQRPTSNKRARANESLSKSDVESCTLNVATERVVLVVTTLVLLLLALGAHTPLFRLLYSVVPGFDKFRGISKFIFPASLFLALLAAMGFDRLLKTRRVGRGFVIAIFVAGGVIGFVGLAIRAMDWLPVLRAISETHESYLLPQLFSNPAFAQKLRTVAETAQASASNSLLLASATALALGGLLVWMRSEARAVFAIGALAVLEVFVFARSTRETFDSKTVVMPEVKNFLDAHPGNYRIANLINPNSALATGAQDVWGNDPSLVRRYAEFMAFSQGLDPDKATQYVSFTRLDPLYAMLRLRYAFVPQNGQLGIAESPNPMPQVSLVGRYRVLEKRDAIFAAMRDGKFDPRGEVILEREPEPKPSGAANGTARVVASTTDWLDLEADTSQPAILLITDVYTPAWQASPLAGSVQQKYELMPANYTLRAVPLAAGHHHLRVEYKPRAFVIGAWISLFSLVMYAAVLAWWLRKPIK